MFSRCIAILAVAFVSALCLASCASCLVIYVAPNGNDNNDGCGWSSPKRTIAAGLSAAAREDEVWVAAGVYDECVKLKDGVALYGGFALGETSRQPRSPAANATAVEGRVCGPVVTVPEGVTAKIDGFTILNGSGGIYCARNSIVTLSNNIILDNAGGERGGGIRCEESRCDITNNTIRKNSAWIGAGIYCAGGQVKITGNNIEENEARGPSGKGGGIAIVGGSPVIADNLIAGNTAIYGGGILCQSTNSPTIAKNTIKHNTVSSYGEGGGISLRGGAGVVAGNTISGNRTGYCGRGGGICAAESGAEISGNTFSKNSATSGGAINCSLSSLTISDNSIADNCAIGDSSFWGEGGGICCDRRSTVTIARNTVLRNEAHYGGGIKCGNSTPTITSNVIACNSAMTVGGGVYFSQCVSSTIGNTFAANHAPDGGALSISGVIQNVCNNIIAFNASGIRINASGSVGPLVRNNNVYGNAKYNYAGLSDPSGKFGNVSLDPSFADVNNGDYHLSSTSPCRNLGDNTFAGYMDKDIDGQNRICGGKADIGADEIWPATAQEASPDRLASPVPDAKASGYTPLKQPEGS